MRGARLCREQWAKAGGAAWNTRKRGRNMRLRGFLMRTRGEYRPHRSRAVGARPFPGSGLYIRAPLLRAPDTVPGMAASLRSGSFVPPDRRCRVGRVAARAPGLGAGPPPRAGHMPLLAGAHPPGSSIAAPGLIGGFRGARRVAAPALPVHAGHRLVGLTRILCLRTYPVNTHPLCISCISGYPARTGWTRTHTSRARPDRPRAPASRTAVRPSKPGAPPELRVRCVEARYDNRGQVVGVMDASGHLMHVQALCSCLAGLVSDWTPRHGRWSQLQNGRLHGECAPCSLLTVADRGPHP